MSSIAVQQGGSVNAVITSSNRTSASTSQNSATATSRNVSITAVQGQNTQQASIVIRKPLAGDTNLEALKNVNVSDLQDGYTLVYDSDTQTWVSQPVQLNTTSIDGGTY